MHLKLKSRLPRVGNGLGIKYIHGQGRLQAVSLATRDAKNEGGSLRRKKFLSRAFSHACAFLCVSFDGPRKERLLVVYGQGKDREISSCVRENSLRI